VRGADRRTFLFLQGPLSPLYRRIGQALTKAGHEVRRINFCIGDWLHWHGPGAFSFRGRFEDWPDWIAHRLECEGVSDLVMHGDTRPYHRQAVIAAERLGISVHVSELGLIRPGFMTLERGGLGMSSRFPVDPEAVARLSARAGEVDIAPRHPASFALQAWQDVSYHLPNAALGWALFPHHRRHTPISPLLDYALWLRRFAGASARARTAEARQEALLANRAPVFLLPLQMEGDYQIVAQSPFDSVRDALKAVMTSFASHAPRDARLAIKSHPLDNGWIDWTTEIADRARDLGLGDRAVFLDGGDLAALMARSDGVVTVNSTVGLDALRAGRPTKTLAPAIYDGPGLTHQGELDTFWAAPQSPDPDRVEAFVTAIAACTQVRGTIHNRGGLQEAVEGMTARLLSTDLVPPELAGPPPRLERARALGIVL
jgi:capsular polysaccharide export protein